MKHQTIIKHEYQVGEWVKIEDIFGHEFTHIIERITWSSNEGLRYYCRGFGSIKPENIKAVMVEASR